MSEALLKRQDKRKSKRLLTEELFVVIENQVDLNFASIDYNALGIAILTDLDLKINSEIALTIGNDDGYLIPDVSSVIRNKKVNKKTGECRYGIEFNYDSRLTTEIKDKLKRLEKILS